jgi:hypothetical protein
MLALALGGLAAVAAPSLAGAAPRHNKSLTIAATPDPIYAGDGVLIYGQLAGTDVGGQKIVLYHRINPAPRFTVIGTTTTNADGSYEFTRADGIVVSNREWFVRGPGDTHSRTVHERVAPLVTLAESSATTTTKHAVRFSGSISPAHPFQRVLIQEQTAISGNGWHTVATGRTGAASNFSISHRLVVSGDYTLRAYFPGDRRSIAGASDSVTLSVQQAQNPSFTITTSNPIVTEGGSVKISGTLDTAGTSTPLGTTEVTLYGKQAGRTLEALATTTTATNGAYSFTETPVYDTVYHVGVTLKPARHTVNLFEGVQDVVTAKASSDTATVGGSISVSGTVSPDKSGHEIHLQIQGPGGHWHDVAGTTLGAGSAYSLSYTFGKTGTLELRSRIDGGPENVGAASAPMLVTVSGTAPVSSLPPGS